MIKVHRKWWIHLHTDLRTKHGNYDERKEQRSEKQDNSITNKVQVVEKEMIVVKVSSVPYLTETRRLDTFKTKKIHIGNYKNVIEGNDGIS